MAQKFLPDDHCNRPTMSDSASASDECGHFICAPIRQGLRPQGQASLEKRLKGACPFLVFAGFILFLVQRSDIRIMKALEERIRQEGQILSDTVLKVDSFLNHQVDTALALEIGKEFAHLFGSAPITKVLTIEASGIQFAMATAIALGVPFIYAKKKKAITLNEQVYFAEVHSFTRQETYQASISQKYLDASDHVLIVDDFLATGAALVGLTDIVKEAGAELAGVGCVIEKSFQEGRGLLEQRGIAVRSLARIASMAPGEVHFIEEAGTVIPPVKENVGC